MPTCYSIVMRECRLCKMFYIGSRLKRGHYYPIARAYHLGIAERFRIKKYARKNLRNDSTRTIHDLRATARESSQVPFELSDWQSAQETTGRESRYVKVISLLCFLCIYAGAVSVAAVAIFAVQLGRRHLRRTSR